jgi:Protein of unknown function (DUF2523)
MSAAFNLVLSALYTVTGFLIKSTIAKFFLFFGLFFVTTEFVPILFTGAASLLPGTSAITNALGGLPAGIWYFLELMRIDIGLPSVISAWATRFVIRRIPIIG